MCRIKGFPVCVCLLVAVGLAPIATSAVAEGSEQAQQQAPTDTGPELSVGLLLDDSDAAARSYARTGQLVLSRVWLRELLRQTKAGKFPSRPPGSSSEGYHGRTIVKFTILPDGTTAHAQIVMASTLEAADQACLDAVQALRLPPLPESLRSQEQRATASFNLAEFNNNTLLQDYLERLQKAGWY